MSDGAIVFIPTDYDLARELYERDPYFNRAVDFLADREDVEPAEVLLDGGPRNVDAQVLGYVRGVLDG